jgi:hypothetical protein
MQSVRGVGRLLTVLIALLVVPRRGPRNSHWLANCT